MARGDVPGAAVTPLDLSLFGRMAMAARVVLGRPVPDWFGPREPLPPVAQDAAVGRQFDYPTGYNLNLSPRALEPVSFAQLRTLADSYDLMRTIIETRRDQVAKLKWNVKPRDKDQQPDQRAKDINAMLRYPDGEHDWDQWVRAIIEDMLVIDAVAIYPRKTRGGKLLKLELIDGATIKRVINPDGRTPGPGEPAYQQVLKGLPAVDYTADELIYRMRNYRTHRVYGFSPVEQVMMTVNIALRRQMHQLQYYTEGNIPEALIGVPATWTTDQIRQFQEYWDQLLEGSTAKRRHAKFVPGDMKYEATKESVLKDSYDEWLARLVCFAFSISPTPFVAQVNRATAESAQQAALEEGLAPIMLWVKSLMDYVIERVLGAPDLEFDWVDEESVDPAVKATIHKTYIEAKVLTPDEVREELGRDPMTPEEREKAFPEPIMEAGPPGAPGEKKPEKDAEKGEYLGSLLKRSPPDPKAVRPVAPINRERRAAKQVEAALGTLIKRGLAAVRDEVIEVAEEVRKADESEFARLMARLKFSGLTMIAAESKPLFERMAKDGAVKALMQIGIDDDDMTDLVNTQATAWASDHAAELVGMKLVDGKWVPNPDARWRIDETTRAGIKDLVTTAELEGWSNDRLAQALKDDYVFSDARAEMIARTETARADVEGSMMAYRESGVVKKKRWIVAQGDFCPTCQENTEAGVIAFKARFPSGELAPPAHPNCRCDVLPVLDHQEE